MYTKKQDHIIDHVGATNWEEVEQIFGGKTLDEIKSQLDEIFPTEDNDELSEMIYDELN